MSEAIARWDSFLAKIRERANETLAAAEEGCAQLLDVNGLDPQPMSIAWMAIENQLHELNQKVEQTWEQKVVPMMGEGSEAQREKAEALRRELERQKEDVELRIFSGAAEKIFEQARVNLAKQHKCAKCGAAMKLRQAFFRSTHLPCEYCNSVNTFVPGSTITAVEWFCAHHLARKKSWPLYQSWLKAERGPRAQAEKALREYTTAYLQARIELVPEYANDFAKDLKGKMAFFYERQE